MLSNNDILPISLFFDNNSEDFSFSKEERRIIENEINHYENLHAVVVEALKVVQKNRGWVTDGAIIAISRMLSMSVSDVEGIATFYSQIFRQPVGRHIIRFCDSMVCYVTGCQSIQIKCEDILNIKLGETTLDDRFTFLPVSCLGRCDGSPVIMVDEDVYVHVLLEDIEEILKKYL